MKCKKRYNILFSMMLLIIVGSVAVLFAKDKLDHVSGDNAGDIVDIVDNDANSFKNPDAALQRANFNNFSTALKHSQAFLKRTDYYKTRARGMILALVAILAVAASITVPAPMIISPFLSLSNITPSEFSHKIASAASVTSFSSNSCLFLKCPPPSASR